MCVIQEKSPNQETKNIPGHLAFSQAIDCESLPAQGFPPFDCLGELHFLLLVFVPRPQVTLHFRYALQDDHPPSTIILRVISEGMKGMY